MEKMLEFGELEQKGMVEEDSLILLTK